MGPLRRANNLILATGWRWPARSLKGRIGKSGLVPTADIKDFKYEEAVFIVWAF